MPKSGVAEQPRALSQLVNDCSFQYTVAKMNHKHDLLYAKRSHVHWFVGEGMESGEYSERREDLAALEKDYEEVQYGDLSSHGGAWQEY